MGKHPSLVIAALALLSIALVIALAKPSQPHLRVKCYFQDAQGLHAGARVLMAGVEVGTVTSVRVRTELRDNPAEVIMFLQTPYELKVPNDSVVALEAAGVLGEVFPEIDIRGASGPPLMPDGVLKTRISDAPTSQQWAECLSNVAAHKPCDLRGRGVSSKQSPASDSTGR
jgi:ABC-type transporter Mla subunit MlaD